MIDLSTVPNVDAGTTNRPNGEPRDDIVPGDGNGTPVREDWQADLYYGLAALLFEAGDTPDGSDEGATTSQVVDAVKTIIAAETSNQLPRNYIDGYEIANNSIAPTTDIDISAGQASDDGNTKALNLAASLIKQIDNPWAEGTNQGGLDTGSVQINTWYYIWAIEKDSDGTIDILISANSLSPTMPTGWTAKRRIRGALLTDGSGNILPFRQKDNNFRFESLINDYSNTSMPTTRVLIPVSVPPGFMGELIFKSIATSGNYVLLQEVNDLDSVPTETNSDLSNSSGAVRVHMRKRLEVDSSSQVAVRGSLSNYDMYVFTQSFYDTAK